MVSLQSSLFDSLESTDSLATAGLGELAGTVERTELAHGAWVDRRPAWIRAESELFRRLEATVPWRSDRRRMYDRMVDVPRLVCFYEHDAELPDPVLEAASAALSSYYEPEFGERFRTAGLCLYRDGKDSVAWHGDTRGRGATEDTAVAIVSLGAPRRLLVRPRGGGTSLRFDLGHGDLFVMGGSCQRTWEHSVPKTCKPVGPRISVQFRMLGVS